MPRDCRFLFFPLLRLLFSCFFHIWRQEGEHFALITLSRPVSFIWLTAMRQVKHSVRLTDPGSRFKKKKKCFQEPTKSLKMIRDWTRSEGEDVKVWLLLLIQVCLSDREGGFIPVLPTLNLAYCFSFLLRMKGIIYLLPPPKHPLCNPLIGAAMTIFLSISLWVSVSAEPVAFLGGLTPDICPTS